MAGVRNPNTEDWTPARVAKLRELKARNYSAAQIARALGGTTRSAVIGKFQTLGLTKRGVPSREIRRDPMGESANPGVKTKALAFDVSPPELLRPRRFTWEDPTP
jgi:hypothetical protein